MNKKNYINDNFKFGTLFLIIFLIIGIYPLVEGNHLRVWSIIVSIMLAFILFFKPSLFRLPNKIWINFGILIGKFLSPVVMFIIFFTIISITGLFLRILNRDLLNLKNKKLSYWIDRQNKFQSMDKQF
jgi:hypothetical protein